MKTDSMRDELIQLGGGAHALATQILGNSEDARDAVQDSFATVLGRPGSLAADEPPDTAAGPEASAESTQRDDALRSALQSLNAEQRQIIVLRDYLDLSYAEIAGVLDVPAGTVMSRLHRARTALGKAYRERYDEPFTS